MLYACEDCGIQRECNVNEGGQRICPGCGMAVTGIVTEARSTRRSPPESSSHAAGDIKWLVGVSGSRTVVTAFDLYEAAEKAAEMVDNPQKINEIKPKNVRHRA